MCVVVCMLDCRFVSIQLCMCPHVQVNFFACVYMCMYVSMLVYIVCNTVYVHVLVSC